MHRSKEDLLLLDEASLNDTPSLLADSPQKDNLVLKMI